MAMTWQLALVAVVAIQALQRKFLQSIYKFDNSSMSSLLGHIPWESNILGESVPMFEKHHSVGSFGGSAQLLTW